MTKHSGIAFTFFISSLVFPAFLLGGRWDLAFDSENRGTYADEEQLSMNWDDAQGVVFLKYRQASGEPEGSQALFIGANPVSQ
ncbi:MAG TPA: hypothetical protein VJC03_04635, partial [bacterium]|nr:hypothetical protein [bacterium]